MAVFLDLGQGQLQELFWGEGGVQPLKNGLVTEPLELLLGQVAGGGLDVVHQLDLRRRFRVWFRVLWSAANIANNCPFRVAGGGLDVEDQLDLRRRLRV